MEDHEHGALQNKRVRRFVTTHGAPRVLEILKVNRFGFECGHGWLTIGEFTVNQSGMVSYVTPK